MSRCSYALIGTLALAAGGNLTQAQPSSGAASSAHAPRGMACASPGIPEGDRDAPDVSPAAKAMRDRAVRSFWQALRTRDRASMYRAVQDLQSAVNVDARMPSAYEPLIAFYTVALEKPELAITLMEAAVRANPRSGSVRFQTGILRNSQNKPHEAIVEYKAALALGFPCLEAVYGNIGNAFVKLGNSSQAIEAYLQALAANPSHHQSRRALAATYGEQGNLTEARKQAQELAERDPQGHHGDWARRLLKELGPR